MKKFINRPEKFVDVMLEGILNGKYANPEHSKQMMDILGRQFYSSRLPQRLQFRAQVAHKTGDWPPFAGNDVGVIFYKGGPLGVVAVFTNQNRGDFFQPSGASDSSRRVQCVRIGGCALPLFQ